SGGTVFAYDSGTLPMGLDILLDGSLSGTIDPSTAPGTYTLGLLAGDASGGVIVPDYDFQVNPAVVIGPQTLLIATVADAFSQTLTATGGSGAGYTFAVTDGLLPAGLTLSPEGTIGGTIAPTVPAGSYAFTITATDSQGATGSLAEL